MSTTVYRSDVVGSLLRPDYLKAARAAFEDESLSAGAFKDAEDQAVNEAIELQEDAGLAVITDGEMRRYAFYGHLIDAIDGFDKYGGWAIPFRDSAGEQLVLQRPVVVSKLRRKRHMCAEEFTYLRSRATRPVKVTLVSAQQAAAYYDASKSSGAYSTIDAYLADLVDLLREEIAELLRLGCTYIQVDSPQYTALLDANLREGYRQRGSDPDRLLDLAIEMDNAVIKGHSGVTFGLHLCRGNNQSKFYAEGDYGPISRIFSAARFDRFLLELTISARADSNRWSKSQRTRTIVLGLISTKTGVLESRTELKRRIQEATRFVSLDRLAISPQCGFASTIEGNALSRDQEKAKLELVVETAREVWDDA
jgi:5-methyltetrahydropteroyltriglutamate--homocysteine methyltransferase